MFLVIIIGIALLTLWVNLPIQNGELDREPDPNLIIEFSDL
jgi:hypothetical protein